MPSSKKNNPTRDAALLQRDAWKTAKQQGELQAQLAAAHRRIDELEKEQAARQAFDDIDAQIRDLKPRKGGAESESICFVALSDWHVGVVATLDSTNGVNETNPARAKAKAERCFTNAARLIEIVARDTRVVGIELPTLGDFGDNHLHEDSAEQNAFMPVQEFAYARDLLASGVRFLRKTFPKIPIRMLCHSGNHGRSTKKIHPGTEHGHSWETMIYDWLQSDIDNGQDTRVLVPRSPISYWKYWDYRVRLMHGHFVRYNGGVGGIHIPLNKALDRYDRTQKADVTILGHFHQLIDTGRALVNGSLVGATSWSISQGFDPETPQQWFQVLSNYKGGRRAMRAPIWLDK